MADDKVYKPEEIRDEPFPDEMAELPYSPTQNSSKDTYNQEKINEQGFPDRRIAKDLTSKSLNTKSKKILGEYGFTESGAIKVGKYTSGSSGEIAISPSGILARNQNGVYTFSVDGDTGEAVVRGGLIVGGSGNDQGYFSMLDRHNTERVAIDKDGIVVYKGNIKIYDEDAVTIVDALGVHSVNNFPTDQVSSNTEISTSSTNFVDVSGSTMDTFTVKRNTRVLTWMTIYGQTDSFYLGNYTTEVKIVDAVDNSFVSNLFVSGEWLCIPIYFDPFTGIITVDYRFHPEIQTRLLVVTEAEGNHTYKLQYRASGGGTARLYYWMIGYMILGE